MRHISLDEELMLAKTRYRRVDKTHSLVQTTDTLRGRLLALVLRNKLSLYYGGGNMPSWFPDDAEDVLPFLGCGANEEDGDGELTIYGRGDPHIHFIGHGFSGEILQYEDLTKDCVWALRWTFQSRLQLVSRDQAKSHQASFKFKNVSPKGMDRFLNINAEGQDLEPSCVFRLLYDNCYYTDDASNEGSWHEGAGRQPMCEIDYREYMGRIEGVVQEMLKSALNTNAASITDVEWENLERLSWRRENGIFERHIHEISDYAKHYRSRNPQNWVAPLGWPKLTHVSWCPHHRVFPQNCSRCRRMNGPALALG